MSDFTNKKTPVWVLAALVLALLAPAHGASVQFVKGKASAPAGASLADGSSFSTRERSQSQVGMDRSFFRVGSDSQVKVGPGRRLALEKGITLVGSDPGGRRQPVEVSIPGYQMKVKGTIQVAYVPGQYLKITVIEGTVTVALQSLAGEFETLEPGQMLIINPADKRLPEPVEVDLSRLVATSQLINSPFGPPRTKDLMDAAAAAQGNDFRAGDVARTPFMLRGASPELSLVRQTEPRREPLLVDNAAGGRVLPEEQTVFQLVNDLADPTATVDQKAFADGLSFYSFPFPPATSSTTLTRTGARTKELTVLMTSEPDDFGGYAGPATLHGTIRADADLFGSVAGKMLIFESQEFGADPFNDYSLHIAPGADILTPPEVGLHFLGAYGVTVDSAKLQAGNATHPDEVLGFRATEGNIAVTNSTLKGYDITMAGSTANTGGEQSITVSGGRLEARNNITLGIPTVRSSVTLQNSTQLAALVGSITVLSKGGAITVDASSLTAGGTITLDALDLDDPSANGLVTLRNASMSADIIRVRGATPSGDALLIDGGTFNAATMLKFYAESTSTLRFRNNVTLNTPHAILSGHTVRVDAGGSVNVSGRADVHAQNHQYNTPGNGTISAGGGLNQNSHASRPAF